MPYYKSTAMMSRLEKRINDGWQEGKGVKANLDQKIYIAGHRGMVGSAIVRHLLAQGVAQSQIVTRTHAD